MRSTKHVRFVESGSGPVRTLMGVDEEAIRARFGVRLVAIIAQHGLPATDVGGALDESERSARVPVFDLPD